ncbi:ABC transporter permease [Kineococcus gynurae]|uniref:Autoinducer 2 import system permease protein LsrC n=1 Tax=Kineococcus gynurae TaxID=452979 RepID=A0ABV5LST3_9ACTN
MNHPTTTGPVAGALPSSATAAAGTSTRGGHLRIARLRDLALIPALLLVGIIGFIISPVFLTEANLVNILQQQSEISLVVAVWLILPVSPGHGLGLELPGALAVPLTLLVGLVVGAVNALLIIKFQLNGFIVTLGMLIALRGLLNGISGGQTFFGLPTSMTYLGTAIWLGLPAALWISLLLFVLGIVVLGYTRFGRSLSAIGGNPAAAKAAGIRVERVLAITLVVAGLLAALAGILLAGRLGSVTANSGNGWIFTVFAGAVIGGISMNGGKGTIFGAFTGILLLFMVQNVLTLAGVAAEWINFLNGSNILGALVVSRVASGRAQAD